MIHLGDITKLNGYDTPMVDVVIGGSPCQNLSVAGTRTGLQGEESSLFLEQIRLIEEMRNNAKDKSIRDGDGRTVRYMLWENVPGAYSSNSGEDFRTVLELVARIIDPTISIPRPPKNKWKTSGCILLDNGSIAWRTFDAEFWGVAQRRRRICLLADFDGYNAADVLFNRCEYVGESNQSS